MEPRRRLHKHRRHHAWRKRGRVCSLISGVFSATIVKEHGWGFHCRVTGPRLLDGSRHRTLREAKRYAERIIAHQHRALADDVLLTR
jgi:hypothetical protein